METFTRRENDLSNAEGYQFEFLCDLCGKPFRSRFIPRSSGIRDNNALGRLWDAALSAAVDECRPRLRQCRGCGRWVCADDCWKSGAVRCGECASGRRPGVG
jgi:hypothetical protein